MASFWKKPHFTFAQCCVLKVNMRWGEQCVWEYTYFKKLIIYLVFQVSLRVEKDTGNGGKSDKSLLAERLVAA